MLVMLFVIEFVNIVDCVLVLLIMVFDIMPMVFVMLFLYVRVFVVEHVGPIRLDDRWKEKRVSTVVTLSVCPSVCLSVCL